MRTRPIVLLLLAWCLFAPAQSDTSSAIAIDPLPQRLLLTSTGSIQPTGSFSVSLHELMFLQVVHSPLSFLEYSIGVIPLTRDIVAGVKVPVYSGDSMLRAVSVGIDISGTYRHGTLKGKYFLPVVAASAGTERFLAHLAFSIFPVEEFRLLQPDERRPDQWEEDGYRGTGKVVKIPSMTQFGLSYFSSANHLLVFAEGMFIYDGRQHSTMMKQSAIGFRRYWSSTYLELGFIQLSHLQFGEESPDVMIPFLSAGVTL